MLAFFAFGYRVTPLTRFVGSIVIQSGLIIADVTVIWVTWKATYRAYKGGQASRLTRVIFRDGRYSVLTSMTGINPVLKAYSTSGKIPLLLT